MDTTATTGTWKPAVHSIQAEYSQKQKNDLFLIQSLPKLEKG